jgi:uncharacterized protein YpmS
MGTQKKLLFVGQVVLILTVLACTIFIGGPAYPDEHIPVSTEAVGELQSAIEAASTARSESGQITLSINETQITSYLAAKLQTQDEPLFTDPQVYLRDGQIQIYGTGNQGYFQATVAIIVTAGVDSQGQLTLELTSADFGPMPVPAGLKDTVTAIIQEAYTGAIGPVAVGFRLESITISSGTMIIIGRTK